MQIGNPEKVHVLSHLA